MKTIKFLAMIMAASALSFTFTACGSDDDEPLPLPTPTAPPAAAPNSITIDDTAYTLKYGHCERHQPGEDGDCMYRILLQSLPEDFLATGHPTRENPLHYIWITFIAPAADALPAGSYPVAFTGLLNATPEGGLPYYRFASHEGCGQLVVGKDGDHTTLAIDPFVMLYTKYEDCNNMNILEDGKTATFSFAYSGKLPFTLMTD